MNKPMQLLLVALSVLMLGCAAPLEMIKAPKQALTPYRYLKVATIQNDVVGTVDTTILDNTLTASIKGILKLKRFDKVVIDDHAVLTDPEVLRAVVRDSSFHPDSGSVAILRTTLTSYDEGSGALRFFIGFGAGSGNVGLDLTVLDRSTNEEIMKAKTEATISGSFSSVKDSVEPLAKAIVNFIKDNFVVSK
jgi:hypothetical protein